MEWPGDFAALESVVQNLLLTSLGDKITLEDVTRVMEQFNQAPMELQAQPTPQMVQIAQPLREARDEFERFYFQHHMKLVNNNMSKLAEISGLERTHLYRKLKQLGINIKGGGQ